MIIRQAIAEKIREGITRYDTQRWTALMTDWSRQGLGYLMCQKYCKCTNITPICCQDGWMVCMVGSFFLSPAEGNYALHKTRYFTQGCDKLVICTDHKPLIPVLTTKHLEDIDNPRLMRLVQKTLSWKFSAIHIPGRKLGGPDALSRNVHGDSKQAPSLRSGIVKRVIALAISSQTWGRKK